MCVIPALLSASLRRRVNILREHQERNVGQQWNERSGRRMDVDGYIGEADGNSHVGEQEATYPPTYKSSEPGTLESAMVSRWTRARAASSGSDSTER